MAKAGRRISVNRTDFILGLVGMITSRGYLSVTAQIQESMLSDAVGAGGVPTALGWAMAVLGALVCVRSVKFAVRSDNDVATVKPANAAASAAEDDVAAGWRPHLLALGLLAILAAYVLITPWLGYIVTTSLLIGVAAWFCGTTFSRKLCLIAAVGGAGLWLMFDPMLSISMPVGTLWGGR